MQIKAKKSIFVSISVFLFLLFFCFPVLAGTPDARLFLVPDKATFLDPINFDMNVKLSSEESANALLFVMSFDPDMLELAHIEINSAVCPIILWQNIDNKNGQVNFICGTPNALIGENLTVAKLNFKKLQAGITTLNIMDHSSLASNNGLGTSIPLQREIHNIYLYK